ncbi:TonB-dependent receptor [Bacteroides cellulosilyticus]|jgi:TonB-linked SusC/RagA family outer membrane protein|uniref:TonB-dependent receptor n=1 Tax=Bacteroides cellulosilyticus TaxID=246787 RepID=A0AAW6M1R6_9BACE|nr:MULTISPECIES: TonB-dependent receptor [Bacteroides]MCQ4944916.1 TonB-dependent receptor [Bacteroides cellulosilyticus]MCS3056946.1 TonB-dependent receptor [Bacteroides cellulosilyticus]MDE8695121.1 TonB-dependent receptor [Bacteroides cellulosilyticus]
MNKKGHKNQAERSSRRLWITLLFFCFTVTGFMQAANAVFAQTTVTATFKNATLSEVLWEVQRQTDFTFVYSTEEVKNVKVEKLIVNHEKIANVLDKCLKGSGLTYTVHDGVIAIKPVSKVEEMAAPQQKTKLNGTVVDETGEAIIGANVIVKGTTNGCTTDLDGHFTLDVDHLPVTLMVSYIGYTRQEIKVTSAKTIKVEMTPDNNLMDEVVITGYGTFKKSAYAGSAASVKGETLKDVPAISFKDLLQGNAPGVQFTSSSGQPGASSSLRIRGMGSFNASNSPLYVIDGVPMRSGTINTMSSDAGLDIMSTINSSDIESVTVIKDAAAASLYGSRAANGVVLITTKKGKAGKPSISLKADWGSSDFAMDYRPIMGGEERRQYIYDGLVAGQIKKGKSEADAMAYADGEIDDYAPVPWCGYTDWDDVLFKKGNHQSYEASLSGGTDRFKYYSSLSYLKQDGIAINSGLERISGRLNVDFQATSKLKLGANVLFATVNQDVYSEGTSYSSPFYTSRNAVVPSDPIYNEDGSWNRDLIRIGDRNPLLSATYDYQREYVTRTFNTIYGEYEFIKDLKFKSTFSYDYVITKGKDWSDPRTSNGDDINGGMSKKYYEYNKMVWANQVSYKTSIARDHHIDALVGYEIDDQYRDYLSGYATNFATHDKNQISNGMKTESVGGNDTRTRMVSYLTRLNYDYKNKYYLGGSFRTDGSSRFQRDNRWGSFWSISGAWRIIEEKFMSPTKDWLTDLKIRASYGVNGTLPSDYFGYMGLSSLTNGYLEQPGIIQSQLRNDDLQWETNYNLNLGLDFALWNRINVTLEYYTRTTKNLLMDRPISMTTGFSSYLMNIGEVKNKGVELEISSTNIQTKDFSWNTTFNISHNKNKIVTLDGMQTEIKSGSQIRKVGKSYRTFYMIEFAGINPETGAPQFYTNDVDENGNYIKDITEEINKAHAIVLDKHAEPNAIGGLSNTLRYKWFDLNFMFSYQFGGYSYDNWAQKTEHGGNDLEANIPSYYKDSWKKPGDITKYELFYEKPSVAMNKVTTTRRLHSTDFIRLKTLTFGFTVPKDWTRKIGIENVRLYASANNLWTWAAYDYYDPEAVSGGTAIWGTPPLKTVTFGINVNF